MSDLLGRLGSAIAAIRLVDTHEHLFAEEERNRAAVDFSYLFPHYAASDLISAGMPPALFEAVRYPCRTVLIERALRQRRPRFFAEPTSRSMSLAERWKAIEPYWKNIRLTGYGTCLRVAIRDLFGVADLTADSVQPLSDAIAASAKPGWYQHVLKDKAGIAVSLLDDGRADVDKRFFAPMVRLEHFAVARTRDELLRLEADTGVAIHSLGDLVQAMHTALDRYVVEGAAGVKIGLAYRRSIRFEKVATADAERIFNRIAAHLGEGPSWEESRPLQDYMMHAVIRAAIERDLPIQIHTGLQEGNENLLTNSNPTLLTNLFIEYREAQFDIFHGAYPYMGELLALAKNFPNVYLDLCWLYIISPSAGARMLHEAIETLPANKIFAFGGDFIIPEGSYGHSVMARSVVSRVLAEKVEEGWMTEEEAVRLAQQMLRDNPAALFRLKLD
ncbi:MAG TPA: amidohydrolase family protein [Candidatus Baltobacteraceae bacterium]|nr:amidohydrolase family protein [Candidatus Baltobacteraceae bacterium]